MKFFITVLILILAILKLEAQSLRAIVVNKKGTHSLFYTTEIPDGSSVIKITKQDKLDQDVMPNFFESDQNLVQATEGYSAELPQGETKSFVKPDGTFFTIRNNWKRNAKVWVSIDQSNTVSVKNGKRKTIYSYTKN
jgi:hypothetical protein